MIEIVEQFTRSKSGDPAKNEDRLLSSHDFAVVADGATSVLPVNCLDSTSPGAHAAQAVISAVENLEPQATAVHAISSATTALKRLPNFRSLRSAATLVIYSNHRRELWRVGDCQFHMQGKTNTYEMRVDTALSEVRALILEYELLSGASMDSLQARDPGREFILPAIRRQAALENNPNAFFRYPVLNGDTIRKSDIEIVAVPKTATELVLASDGYPELFPSLEQTERHLSGLLERDPLLFREFRSTKGVVLGNESYDDRSYLRIRI